MLSFVWYVIEQIETSVWIMGNAHRSAKTLLVVSSYKCSCQKGFSLLKDNRPGPKHDCVLDSEGLY